MMGIFAELNPPYSTIVADPPWPYEDGPTARQRERGRSTYLPYSTMTLGEIAALPVADLGKIDAHLFLWTTQRFLWDAPAIVKAWGFTIGPQITWCKPPNGHQSGNAFAPSTEYLLVCRRNHGPFIRAAREAAGLTIAEVHRAVRGGKPTGLCPMWEQGTRYPNPDDWQRLGDLLGFEPDLAGHLTGSFGTWFQWPIGAHSEKPDAAMDLVDAVAPGPYVELFCRRPRFGWDSWGKGYEGQAA